MNRIRQFILAALVGTMLAAPAAYAMPAAEQNASAQQAQTAEQQKSTQPVQPAEDEHEKLRTYLTERADAAYIKTKDDFDFIGAMHMKQTMYDAAVLRKYGADSFEDLGGIVDEDGYKIAEMEAVLFQSDSMVGMYDLGAENDYLVAFVDTNRGDYDQPPSNITDHAMAYNNDFGQTIDGYRFDKETGIAYIPKAAFFRDGIRMEQLAEEGAAIRMQTMIPIADPDVETRVEVSVDSDVKAVQSETFDYQDVIFNTNSEIRIDGISRVDAEDIRVYANGMEAPLAEESYEIGEDDTLLLGAAPAELNSVEVEIREEGLLEKAANAFAREVHAAIPFDSWAFFKGADGKPLEYKSEWIRAYQPKGRFVKNTSGNLARNPDDQGGYTTMEGFLRYGDGVGFNNRDNVYISWTAGANSSLPADSLDLWKDVNGFSSNAGNVLHNLNNKMEDQGKHGSDGMRILTNFLIQDVRQDPNRDYGNAAAEWVGNIDKMLAGKTSIGMMCAHIEDGVPGAWSQGHDGDWSKLGVRCVYIDDQKGYMILGFATSTITTQGNVCFIKVRYESSGSAKVVKTSTSEEASSGNGNYALAGAVYQVFRSRADAQAGSNAVATMTTEANGTSNTVSLPAGTYFVKEKTAPKGFVLNDEIRQVTIGAGETTTVEMKDRPKSGTWELEKVDRDGNRREPQGDATLAGAQFLVEHYDKKGGTRLHTWTFRTGADARIIPSDEALAAGTLIKDNGKIVFPLGFYTVTEKQAPTGYLIDSEPQTFTISGDGASVKLTFRDRVIRGNVELFKYDIETGRNEAIAGGSLAGINFELRNASAQRVWWRETTFEPGEQMCIVPTGEDGHIQLQDLPYGTYTLQELAVDKRQTRANESYLRTDGAVHTFAIREDGATVSRDTGGNALVAANQIKRANVSFRKVTENDEALAYIPFVITQVQTGEKHLVVTDATGTFDSARYDHTLDTNMLDALIETYDADQGISSEQLADIEYGTWFGRGRDGTMANADNAKAALPYGDYTLTELRCAGNEGLVLIEDWPFSVYGDQAIDLNGEGLRLNNIVNRPDRPVIATQALDDGTKDHIASIAAETGMIHLTDTVTAKKLTKDKTYVLRAVLMDRATEAPAVLETEDGLSRTIRGETTFTATGQDMEIAVPLAAFRAPDEEKTIVVYETLYEVDPDTGAPAPDPLAEHREIEDGEQTIVIPRIGTTAQSSDTGSRVVPAAENVTVVDRVDYANLLPGRDYTITGVLMRKGSGEPLTDAEGNEIRGVLAKVNGAEGTYEGNRFTADAANGAAELTFTFDATLLAGEQIVAFETVTYNDRVVALHHDINDADQTVYVPEIRTTAVDAETGEHLAKADEEVVIVDTVSYRGLDPGQSYVAEGRLMDTSGEPVLVSGEPVVASSEVFCPTAPDGAVEVRFALNGSELAGRSVVVFERLYMLRDGQTEEEAPVGPIAVHEDLTDEDQTVRFEEVHKPEDDETGKRPDREQKKPTPTPTPVPTKTPVVRSRIRSSAPPVTQRTVGSPRTGDDSNIARSVFLIGAAAAGIGIALGRKRRGC